MFLIFQTLVVFGCFEGMTPVSYLMSTPLEEFKPPAKIDPGETAAIVYTTGTTGLPKGSLVSHRNMVSQILMTG